MTPISLFGVAVAAVSVVAAYRLGFSQGFSAGKQAGLDEGKREGKREGAREGSMRGYAVGFDRGKRSAGQHSEQESPRTSRARWGYAAAALLALLALYIAATTSRDPKPTSADAAPPPVEVEELSVEIPGD